MAALTKTQLNYIIKRLAERKKEALAAGMTKIVERFGTRLSDEWTDEEKMAMIHKGVAKISSKFDRYTYTLDAFEYPLHPNAAIAAQFDAAERELNTALDEIEQQVLDKLIMTPNTEALAFVDGAFL